MQLLIGKFKLSTAIYPVSSWQLIASLRDVTGYSLVLYWPLGVTACWTTQDNGNTQQLSQAHVQLKTVTLLVSGNTNTTRRVGWSSSKYVRHVLGGGLMEGFFFVIFLFSVVLMNGYSIHHWNYLLLCLHLYLWFYIIFFVFNVYMWCYYNYGLVLGLERIIFKYVFT